MPHCILFVDVGIIGGCRSGVWVAKTSSETVFENPNLEPNPCEFNPCIEFTLNAEILFTKKR